MNTIQTYFGELLFNDKITISQFEAIMESLTTGQKPKTNFPNEIFSLVIDALKKHGTEDSMNGVRVSYSLGVNPKYPNNKTVATHIVAKMEEELKGYKAELFIKVKADAKVAKETSAVEIIRKATTNGFRVQGNKELYANSPRIVMNGVECILVALEFVD